MLKWNDYYPHTLRQVERLQLPHAEVLAEHHAKAFAFFAADPIHSNCAPSPVYLDVTSPEDYRKLVDAMLNQLIGGSNVTRRLEFLEAIDHPISPAALVRDFFAS